MTRTKLLSQTKKMSARSAGAALAAAACLAATSCGIAAPTGNPQSARSETVVIGARLMAETLDPLQASNAVNDFYDAPVYDALVKTVDGKVTGQLAESWELDASATTLKVKLRDGVVFHSGNRLTAADVVYSLDRAKRIGTGAAAFVADYASAAATDDRTLAIRLARPNVDIAEALTMLYIVDSKLVSEHAGSDSGQQWLAGNDAGSGPYTITGFKPSQQVSLKRFEKYFAPLENQPAAIEMRMISDAGAIRDELASGGIDIGYEITAADQGQFKDESKYQIVRIPVPTQTYVYMNTQGPLTSDPRVREAIQLAYDYQGHIDTIMKGRATLATGLVSPGLECRVEFDAPHQDLSRAKQLIAEAGATGKGLSLAYQTGPAEFNAAGISLQSALREIGLNVTVKNITFPQYLQMISAAGTTPDLAIAWDYPAYPSATAMINRAWNSKAIGQTNYTRYSNPQVDALLNEAMGSTDRSTACKDAQDAQRLIEKDRTVLRISNKTIEITANRRVTNIVDSPTGHTFEVGLLQLKK